MSGNLHKNAILNDNDNLHVHVALYIELIVVPLIQCIGRYLHVHARFQNQANDKSDFRSANYIITIIVEFFSPIK